MLNLFQHLIKSTPYETLKSLDPELNSGPGDKYEYFNSPVTLDHIKKQDLTPLRSVLVRTGVYYLIQR
jgi:hypothetical protein